jgi:site-specific recombinase XerD
MSTELSPVTNSSALAPFDIVEAYHRHLAEQVASGQVTEKTAAAYRVALRHFLKWGKETQPKPRRVVQQWMAHLKEKYSPASINLWLFGLRSFFGWAVSEGHYPSDPTFGINALKRRSSGHRRDVLSNSEMRRLLSAELSPRDRAIIHLLAYTGCRGVELDRADYGDVESNGERIIIRVQGKGSADKDNFVVVSHPAAKRALLDYLADRGGAKGLLFQSHSDRNLGARLTVGGIQQIVRDAYRLAGVVGVRKTPHSLRHSCATSAATCM